MFYLKHVHPSHSSGEYVLVQMIQVSTPFFRWNQLRIDLVSCYMLHVTCYMWSVMCCMWLVTCKSFIIYWETGDQELCSWFFVIQAKPSLLGLACLVFGWFQVEMCGFGLIRSKSKSDPFNLDSDWIWICYFKWIWIWTWI